MIDESDDIRGGMGFEGLQELANFVQQGGTLIVEGSTASLMAEYAIGSGVTVEHPQELFARGSILRGVFADTKSPIAYGYEGKDLPIYFNQDPVFNVTAGGGGFGGFGGFGGGRGGASDVGQNVTPNAVPIHVAPLEPGGVVRLAGRSRSRRTRRPWRTRRRILNCRRRTPARHSAVSRQPQRHAALRHAGRR